MTLDRQKLQDASKTFRAVFMEALREDEGPWRMLVAEEKASGKEITQNWLGPAGQVEEWVGDRPAEKFRGYEYTLANKKWANAVRVDRVDLEDDNLSLYRGRIRQAAKNFDIHRTKLLFQTLLLNAFGSTQGTAYDGQFFFDTDHLDDEETAQSNKGTAVFSTAALDAAIENMMQRTDSKGDYIGVHPTHIFVPPQLRDTVKKVLGNAHIIDDSGTTTVTLENHDHGAVTPVILPWLAGQPTYWFLADLSKELKPFRYQIRKEVEWQSLERLDSDRVFDLDEFRYGGRARYNIGYGFWQMMYGSDGSV